MKDLGLTSRAHVGPQRWATGGRWLRRAVAKALPFLVLAVIWQALAVLLRNSTAFGGIVLPGLDQMVLEDFPELATLWGGVDRLRGMAGATIEPSYWGALEAILYHTSRTLGRVLGGTAAGLLLGALVGFLVGVSTTARYLTWVPLGLARMVPLLALGSLFIIWFGGSELSVILFVTYGVFVTMVMYLVSAIRNIDPIYGQFAATLGASKFQVVTKVILPAVMPELAAGLNVSIGLSWAITLGGEFLAVKDGIGRMILIAESFFETGKMLILVAVIVVLASLTTLFANIVSKWLTRWVPRR